MNTAKNWIGMALIVFCAFITGTEAMAQRVSIIGNVKAFGIDKVGGEDSTQVNYKGETSFSVNLRIFDNNLWAFRLGAGLDKLKYQFGDSSYTNYDVVRKSITAYLGLEKHFEAGPFTPYLGVFVPITFNGEDSVKDNLSGIVDQIDNGDISAGFSLLGGLNLRLFKVLRIGGEASLGFSQFKEEVLRNLTNNPSAIKLKNLEFNTEITFGFAF
ncbi:hypothetical protein BVG80_08585 [Sphingobacteriales bacterium TSM_CSM]|nr:hypothetical protein BVG80_08585 [Sphingobacteriales bacterium TSM_CSM]